MYLEMSERERGSKALFSLLNSLIVTSRQTFVLRWDKSFMSDNKRVSGRTSRPTGRSSKIKKDLYAFRFPNYVWSQPPVRCVTKLMTAVTHLGNVCLVTAQIPDKSGECTLKCKTAVKKKKKNRTVTDSTESQFMGRLDKSHWTWLSASVSWADTHWTVIPIHSAGESLTKSSELHTLH